jgi:hypothetical protein
MPGLNDCHCRRKASRWQGVAADHNDGSVLGYVVAHPAHNDVADTAPAAHMAGDRALAVHPQSSAPNR